MGAQQPLQHARDPQPLEVVFVLAGGGQSDHHALMATARHRDVLARDVVLDHLHVLDALFAVALREVGAGRRHQARRLRHLDGQPEVAPEAAAPAEGLVRPAYLRDRRYVVVRVPHDGDAFLPKPVREGDVLRLVELVQQRRVEGRLALEQLRRRMPSWPEHLVTAALELAQRQDRAVAPVRRALSVDGGDAHRELVPLGASGFRREPTYPASRSVQAAGVVCTVPEPCEPESAR